MPSMWPRDCCGCANMSPRCLKQTWKFVQVNGYINYRLTGRVAMDPAHAVLLQMRNYSTGELVRCALLRLRSCT